MLSKRGRDPGSDSHPQLLVWQVTSPSIILLYMMQLLKHCEDIRCFNEKALSGDLVDLRNVHTILGLLDSACKDFCCMQISCYLIETSLHPLNQL